MKRLTNCVHVLCTLADGVAHSRAQGQAIPQQETHAVNQGTNTLDQLMNTFMATFGDDSSGAESESS